MAGKRTGSRSRAKRRSKRGVRSFAIKGKRRGIELVLSDCVEGMRALRAGSVDAIVTSPPYNAGKGYSTYDDTISREEYLDWTRIWAASVARVMSPGSSFFLNIGARPMDPWIVFDVVSVFRDMLVLQNTIHWVKSISIEPEDLPKGWSADETATFGHYQPINSKRYLNGCQEYVFHFTKSGKVQIDRLANGVPYQDKSNVSRWKSAGKDVRCRGNTWFIPYRTIQSRDKERPHPATFPVKLPEMCLKMHGLDRIRLAMDPFLGLGSTAVACARLGVPFKGFEIDREYLKQSAQRVAKELKRK